jgi:hypothetical protein
VITEEIRIDQNDFEWRPDKVEKDKGEVTWTLNEAGTMTEPDEYNCGWLNIHLSNFWPNDLPATTIFKQKYFWKCPTCTAAAGSDVWRQVSGPSDIKLELFQEELFPKIVKVKVEAYDKTFIYDYVGIAVLENLQMNPDSITANGTDQSQGTVDIIPEYRAVVWTIQGNAHGCTIDNTGKVTAGTTAGTITVQADAEEAYSSKLTPVKTTLKLNKP